MAEDDQAEKRGPQTEIVYECAVCEKTFEHPGMCQTCKVLLKPRGE